MPEVRAKCPVCDGDLDGVVTPERMACPRCRFPYAGITLFSNHQSLEAWKQEVQAKRAELLQKMQDVCRRDHRFYMSGDTVVCKPSSNKTVALIGPRGVRVLDDPAVVQYSAAGAAGRNEAFLLEDGSVMSSGDNSYLQCETGSLAGITKVLATSNCTYGITASKEIAFCGQAMSSAMESWRNISDLAAGAFHVVGLTTDGRVLIGGEALNRGVASTIEAWRGISDVAAAGNATLALREDGHVLFAGKDDDPRRLGVSGWVDVVDIALESVYAVGLTKGGAVLLAGESRNDYLDMGRKEAASWSDIVAIACGRSCIVALCMDGSLRMAGNIREAGRIAEAWEDVRPHFMERLIVDAA